MHLGGKYISYLLMLLWPLRKYRPIRNHLKTSLSDWYPVYQVNAYIKDADKMAAIYSVLHQNIQDYFNKAGIEIMSPHYIATRDGNEITIPKETAEE